VEKVWLELLLAQIAAIFDKRDYLPASPVSARVGLALFLGRWEIEILTSGREVALPLVEACSHSDPLIAARAQDWLAHLENPTARQALCEMVIHNELPLVEQIILEQGWFPERLGERVLFYFITGQLDKYEELDFDHRLLRAAYHSATPSLRRRLAALIRALGRVDLLEVIVGGETRRRGTQITAEEAEVLVQTCAASQDWAGLWSLVPVLPLRWSVEAIRQLARAGWQGQSESDWETLSRLIPLACGEIVTDEEEAGRWLPLALLRSQARLSASKTGRINSLAFSPRRPLLAIATQNSKIILWNMNTAQPEKVIDGSAERPVGSLTFSGDDLLCWGERTRMTDASAKIYVWQDGKRVELGEHRGGVMILRAVGEHWLLSGGRDGRVILWDLSARCALKEIYLGYDLWVRDIAVSSDRQKAVVLHHGATVLSLPEFEVISETAFDDFGTVPRAVFAPGERGLVICKMESYPREIVLDENWQLRPQLEILKKASIQGKHHLPGLGVLAELGLVLIRTEKGAIEIIDWASRQPMAYLELPVGRNFYHYITCLEISPDGSLMALNDLDATIMLWDLRPLTLRRLFSFPLARAGVTHLAALAAVLEADTIFPKTLEASFQFIEIVLKDLRLRYEIELSEIKSIQAGEFDIELLASGFEE
jgi:hypothetical protein